MEILRRIRDKLLARRAHYATPVDLATPDGRARHVKLIASKTREKLEAEIRKENARNQWHWLRRSLYATVHSPRFESTCGCIILFNLFLVVVETDNGVDEGTVPGWAKSLTHCLLVIYSIELIIKLYVYRGDFWKEVWNVLDFFIVGVDLVFLLVALVVDEMPSISVLRVFRLVRLARAFKAAKSFHELHSLLRACTCACKAIFWGMVMMLMTLTVWGILAVQLIHPVNKEIAKNKPWVYQSCERCPRAYSTVFDSMLTFWKQLVAGDSWGTLCEPIIEEAKWTSVFFMMVLVTVNLALLNCILAVVVEAGAAAAAADQHERAMEREKATVQAEGLLINLCEGLDSDGSGSLTIQEFIKGFHDNHAFKECMDTMHVTEADMAMIFNICDEDDSGDVDYNEFVHQLRRIKHSSDQILLHYVTDIRHVVNKFRPDLLKPPAKHSDEEHQPAVSDWEGGPCPNCGNQALEGAFVCSTCKAQLAQPTAWPPDQLAPCDKAVTLEFDPYQESLQFDPYQATAFPEVANPHVQSELELVTDKSNQAQERLGDSTDKAAIQATEDMQVFCERATVQSQASKVSDGRVESLLTKLKTSIQLERIWQSSEDFVTIMTDLAQQSKAQAQLFDVLADGLQQDRRAYFSKDDCMLVAPRNKSSELFDLLMDGLQNDGLLHDIHVYGNREEGTWGSCSQPSAETGGWSNGRDTSQIGGTQAQWVAGRRSADAGTWSNGREVSADPVLMPNLFQSGSQSAKQLQSAI